MSVSSSKPNLNTAPPIVDLGPCFNGSPQQLSALAQEIGELAHRIGFFYVVNHGIPADVSARYLDAMKAFFELPLAVREAIDKQQSPQFRGWEQLGSELTNNRVDYREQLDIGVEAVAIPDPVPYYKALVGPNQWPPESLLPGFKDTVNDYFERLSALSRLLLRLMSRSLGLEENHIERVFGARPSPYLKLIRYPRTQAGGQGVGTHKDSGFLTLLLQDEHAGLEAQANDDKWYQVDPVPGSLVVNTGELLQLLTHNYFIATPHRVVNRGETLRYSSAFFYSPDLDTPLDPLPIDAACIERARRSLRHNGEGLMASRREMAEGVGGMESLERPRVFGDKYWQRWVRSYPGIARRYYPEHVD